MKKALLIAAIAVGAINASAAYDLNYPADSNISHGSRSLSSFTITVDGVQSQTVSVGQKVKGKLYFDLTDKCVIAMPGKKTNIAISYSGTWMNSYFYLDRDNNGIFDVDINNQAASDLLGFSYYREKEWTAGINSAGASVSSGDNIKMPEFEIPANLAPGTYHARFKIDWNSVNPGGATADNSGNTGNNILTNGGSIVDFTVMVTDNESSLTVKSANGSVTLVDGSDPNGAAVPAQGTLDFLITPDEGYLFDGMSVTGGYAVPQGLSLVEPALGYSELHFTALSMNGNVLSIPVEYLGGHTVIDASFLPADGFTAGGNYESDYNGTKSNADGFTQISVNGIAKNVSSTELHTPAALMFNAQIDQPLSVKPTFVDTASKFTLSIDYNQDGTFNNNSAALSCEVIAQGNSTDFDAVTLPVELRPGVYRARLEADGHSDVDFFINLHKPVIDLNVQPLNCLVLNPDQSPLALTASALNELKVLALPVLPGFVPSKTIIRHGYNLNGPALVNGNPQWSDYEASVQADGTISIPDSIANGDLVLYLMFEESENSEWTKVWGDEFNSGKFDANRWHYQTRLEPTWKRFIAGTDRGHELVNTFENGCYNAHCFATPADLAADEGVPMISGALMSQHRFDVKYGRVEARIKTTPHTGNFPAFWMLPTYSELEDLGLNGWPRDGEIDIWEQINTENRSYHTIHSGWTRWDRTWSIPPKQYSPQNSNNVACDANLWHVFALEWEVDELRWYVDGKKVFTYHNAHYSEDGDGATRYFEKITWPFDKHFYVIVNQSVGDGSWAANVDQSFHYLTLFDYVRVYQKKTDIDHESQIEGNGDDLNFYVPANGAAADEPTFLKEVVNANATIPSAYYDLQGRRVANPTHGLYISKGQKVIL